MNRVQPGATAAGSLPKLRIFALLLVAVFGASAFVTAADDGDDKLHVVAEFTDASPVLMGSDVKVAGVKVGTVESIELVQGVAHIGLELEPDALPVYENATANVRPVSLLGERYIDLKRGTPQAPVMPDGGHIPVRLTGQNADLDELLNTLDDPTGNAVAALVTTLGAGMQDNGRDLAKALKVLAPAMSDTDRLVRVLNEQQDVLDSLVGNALPVAKSLAKDNGRALDKMISAAERLLATTADNKEKLDESLVELPDTLRVARSTLADLAEAANDATPTLADLRPVTDELRSISAELKAFSTVTGEALDAANPLLAKANEMLVRARPVASTLRKAGGDLKTVSAGGAALARHLSIKFDDVFALIRNWALATNGGDGLSHFFRGLVVVSDEYASGMVPAGTAPKLPETPALPKGLRLPGLDLNGKPLDGLLSPKTSKDGGVTGLDSEQESGLLGSLLGGS